MPSDPLHVEISWRQRAHVLEYQWVGATAGAIMVFLHEGLGSVAMWKQFPDWLCRQLGLRGLVYSRPGYGKSTPRPANERWATNFMHQQAHEVLPALFNALAVKEPIHLFGHSDGASIALLYCAAQSAHLPRVLSCTALAPHVFVEPVTVTSIASARQAFETTSLKTKLARYHNDVDSAFYGWCDAWLSPEFLAWRIDSELATMRCPLLLIQGNEDQYGSFAQLDLIGQRVANTTRVELPQCGHSPHLDQPTAVLTCVEHFLLSHQH
jgi:pimeloyl-ACP methyl ester carboxylesterase